MARGWNPFPHDASSFAYEGDALAAHWERLHRGDREPFPSAEHLEELERRYGVLGDGDAETAALGLQDAWRAYHRGDFQAALAQGLELGIVGHYVANKATGIYANYLEKQDKTQLRLYEEVSARAIEAQEAMPEHANSFYIHAFALGRYSQGISVAKALARGLGRKIKESLEQALVLEPEHADAHTALGLYHAEVIDKVGKMVGKLTYGASTDEAMRHFECAVELFPESAVARMEYANGLLLLKGDEAWDEASALYVAAAEAEPADAMERLDVEQACSQLE